MWPAGKVPGGSPAVFYGVLAALVLLGVRDVLFQYEENRCSMTYMFEYPEYLKIKLPRKIARRFPAYELYLYGEGSYAEQNRNLLLTGIPVLFLPGNAGSYKQDFYIAVKQNWIQKAQEIKNLTTLSVAGGFRDYQVRSELAFLPRTSHQSSALSVASSAVPRVWASTDHLSIVWCKELILATIRAFFDLIDENTKQITEDPQKRMLVLNHHFLRHPAKFFEEKPESVTELSGELNWIQIKTSNWSYTIYNESDGKYFIFPLSNHRKTYTHVYCQSSMLDTNSWIYGCINNTSSMCLQSVDLTWKAELLPTIKAVTLKLQDYPSLTHLVLHGPAVNGNKFTLDCEFFNEASRTVQLPVTQLFTFGLTSSKIVLNSTGLIHKVQLQHFGQIYQAFKILIESRCQSLRERKPSVYQLHIPWSNEDSLTLSQVPSSTEISAKLHISQPENDTAVPLLNIYSSSDCQYEVTIKTSFLQVLGQVLRFHGGILPVYIISNILLAYGRQLRSLISTGHCLDFVPALTKAAKPYIVEPIVNIVKFLLGLNWLKGIWDILLLPELDAVTVNNQDLWFPFVSLMLFMFGSGIAYWGGILFNSSLRILSSLYLALTRPSGLPSDNSLITRRMICVAASMVFLSWATCGALAILMTYFHYIFKVIKLHSNVRTELSVLDTSPKNFEQSSLYSKKEVGKNCGSVDGLSDAATSTISTTAIDSIVDSIKMHVTVINLLTWIALLSCPSLIYWLNNLRYHIRLDPDPCRSVAFFLTPILGILMNASTPKVKTSKLLKIAVHLPLPLSVAVVVFAPMHLYRVSYLIIIPLFLHALCCIV
ncbi:GPI inositol-deacylase isoform X2 [Rhineura floridana]|uniref:GPI inositol-deacylase isoform X2 n=1 Tax=Rhineura floridana TaxID=261503 RepID=UPI002AC885B8|nr:GPI inositol-deacylase isoform X2 [Rhineura floridana]